MKQRKFVLYLLLFFAPVILGYAVVEYLTLQLPLSYKVKASYLEENAENIEVLVLGSSQMMTGINPEHISQPTINLASGNQHHDTDFKLLKQLYPKLPQLHTVVLETSYSHFELPHNGKDFWKNSVFLKYYGLNNFERTTYFKDKLIYLSFPEFFSEKLISHYVDNASEHRFNEFGYNTNGYEGLFRDLGYDETKINTLKRFKINKEPNLEIFKNNTRLFFEMLDYLESKNLNVILSKAPMYKTYLPQRVPEILERRDSIVTLALQNYQNTTLLSKETDTIHYTVRDYWNQSHLNPDGAEIFSKSLDSLLQKATH